MESVKKILDIGYNGIDEWLIEEVVEKIKVHENYFEWKLNFYDELKLYCPMTYDYYSRIMQEYIDRYNITNLIR